MFFQRTNEHFYLYIFIVPLNMDFKDYLLSQKEFQLGALAKLMWPNMASPESYLSKKLHNKNDRKFTIKDERLARKALKELGIHLVEVSKKKDL